MDLKNLLIIPLCIVLGGCGSRYEELPLSDVNVSEDAVPESISGGSAGWDSLSEDEADEDKTAVQACELETIYVYVCGRVNEPGVYQVPEGSRIYQLIEMAGGLTAEADTACINQAAVCGDGEMIYVPTEGETGIPAVCGVAAASKGAAQDKDEGLIDINTADTEGLQRISGIGASRAKDIIAYREENGGFSTKEDIMKVPGIKEGMFNKIKDQIKV